MWDNTMRGVVRENYPNKTCKEIASMLSVSESSLRRVLRDMGLSGKRKELLHQNKQTCRTVGSRRRANNKYNTMLARTRGYNNKKNLSYANIEILVSREEFILWYMPKDFAGASVDRIDKNKHYSLDNMQVIPLAENIRKDKIKAKDGKCVCFVCKQTKPIDEFCADKRRLNGHSTMCKECERIRTRENNRKRRRKLKLK